MSNEDWKRGYRDGYRDGQEDRQPWGPMPYNPMNPPVWPQIPSPTYPQWPDPNPPAWAGCPVCGMVWDGRAMLYCCMHPTCPSRVTCSYAAPEAQITYNTSSPTLLNEVQLRDPKDTLSAFTVIADQFFSDKK